MSVSKTQQKCVSRYVSAHYDKIDLTVPKGRRALIQQAAEERGVSVNAYITSLICADLGLTTAQWKSLPEPEPDPD